MKFSLLETISNLSFRKEILEVYELELMDLEHPYFIVDGTKLNDLAESGILECHPLLYTICAYTGSYSGRIRETEFMNVSKFLLSVALDTELDDNLLTKVLKDARVLDNLLKNGAGDAIDTLKVLCCPDYIWLSNPLIRVVNIAKALLCDDELLESYIDNCVGEKVCKGVVGILKKYAK